MTSFSASAALSGLLLGWGLIVAIGAQNAFVLRQGLRRKFVAPVVAICILVDATLISLGTAGFGALVTRFPQALSVAAWGGAIFLLVHGALSLRSALTPQTLEAASGSADTLGTAIVTVLAVSLLNPHVYLDTVVLLGSVASQYAGGARLSFALGAVAASASWFLVLGFGARLLSPLFARPAAWRVLDLVIAGVMWWIAGALILGQLG